MVETATEIRSLTLIEKLIHLREEIDREAQNILSHYCPDDVCLYQSKSAKNLGHYLAMRRHDLRTIQDELTEIGVSSLGRCEPHVMHTFNQVINILQGGYSPTQGANLPHGGPGTNRQGLHYSDGSGRAKKSVPNSPLKYPTC